MFLRNWCFKTSHSYSFPRGSIRKNTYIICCCVTNYPKTWQLRTISIYYLSFCESESGTTWPGTLARVPGEASHRSRQGEWLSTLTSSQKWGAITLPPLWSQRPTWYKVEGTHKGVNTGGWDPGGHLGGWPPHYHTQCINESVSFSYRYALNFLKKDSWLMLT